MADDEKEFDRKLAEEQAKGFRARMEDEPGIGLLPNGELNVVSPGEAPDEPIVMTGEGAGDDEEDELGDLSDLDEVVSVFGHGKAKG